MIIYHLLGPKSLKSIYYAYNESYCSFLSRLKNSYRFDSTRRAALLTEDYFAEFALVNLTENTISDAAVDTVLSLHKKFKVPFTRKRVLSNLAFSFRSKPVRTTAQSWNNRIYFSVLPVSKVTNNYLPTTEPSSNRTVSILNFVPEFKKTKSWKSYFEKINGYNLVNTKVYTTESAIWSRRQLYDSFSHLDFVGEKQTTHKSLSGVKRKQKIVKVMFVPPFEPNEPQRNMLNLTNLQRKAPSQRQTKPQPRAKARSRPKLRSPPPPPPVKCYTCGLNETGLGTSRCYGVFDTHKKRSRLELKLRTACKHKVYLGGCFKRFLDVGRTYGERGCRTMPPQLGKSFASIRLKNVEYMLHGIEEGCAASPHASITPFSRAISLFVRYHVCVCKGAYCNSANNSNSIIFYMITIINTLRRYYNM